MIIGITGGYCTGKSAVLKMFKRLGAKTISLDELAHNALRPNTESFRKIVNKFGRDVLVNKKIDRINLAKKAFGFKKNLDKLNSIIHPVVIKQMNILIKKFSREDKIIAIEAPLLFEAGIKKYFDYIIVVKTDKKNQIRRAVLEKGLNEADILKRINSQWPLGRKIRQADFIIDNSHSFHKTLVQVKNLFHKFEEVRSGKV